MNRLPEGCAAVWTVFQHEEVIVARFTLAVAADVDVVESVHGDGCCLVIPPGRPAVGMLPEKAAGGAAVLARMDVEIQSVPDEAGDDDVVVGIHCHCRGLVCSGRAVVGRPPGNTAAVCLELDRVIVVIGVAVQVLVAGDNYVPQAVRHHGPCFLFATPCITALPDDVAACTMDRGGECQEYGKNHQEVMPTSGFF